MDTVSLCERSHYALREGMATRQPSMRDRDEDGDGEMEMRDGDERARQTHTERNRGVPEAQLYPHSCQYLTEFCEVLLIFFPKLVQVATKSLGPYIYLSGSTYYWSCLSANLTAPHLYPRLYGAYASFGAPMMAEPPLRPTALDQDWSTLLFQ